MLGYEEELFDEYNGEYEDLHNDAYINDHKNEILEIEIQNIMEEYMSFEEYCKLRNIDVNTLDEEQYDNLWLDYFFDIGGKGDFSDAGMDN